MYGNWGGGNYSGGRSGAVIPENPAPSADSLDECFVYHDYCYDKNDCSLNDSDKNVEKICDMALLQCMERLPENTNDWSHPPRGSHDTTADNFRSKAMWLFKWKWR